MPLFNAAPIPATCKMNGIEAHCMLMLEEDYVELLLKAKAMCHALGGSNTDCQWP